MAISDSNESGYAKKRVLWRRENKANSQKRDCRVASLLAMTARGREPIVENKANLRFRPVWTTWAHRCTIGKLALAAATPRRNRIVRNKANFDGGTVLISDSKERGYAKKRALCRCENKANSQNRDCRVASLLAMTGRSGELIVRNKANFRCFWAENEGRVGKQSQLGFPAGMGDLGPPLHHRQACACRCHPASEPDCAKQSQFRWRRNGDK